MCWLRSTYGKWQKAVSGRNIELGSNNSKHQQSLCSCLRQIQMSPPCTDPSAACSDSPGSADELKYGKFKFIRMTNSQFRRRFVIIRKFGSSLTLTRSIIIYVLIRFNRRVSKSLWIFNKILPSFLTSRVFPLQSSLNPKIYFFSTLQLYLDFSIFYYQDSLLLVVSFIWFNFFLSKFSLKMLLLSRRNGGLEAFDLKSELRKWAKWMKQENKSNADMGCSNIIMSDWWVDFWTFFNRNLWINETKREIPLVFPWRKLIKHYRD